jgi:Family of unknown function (DUF6252)
MKTIKHTENNSHIHVGGRKFIRPEEMQYLESDLNYTVITLSALTNQIIIPIKIMKKTLFISALLVIFIATFSGCSLSKVADPTPEVATGSASASFNGATWKAESASSLLGGTGTTQILTISMQLTEKDNSEAIAIGISSFTGVGTYNYGGTSDKVSFTMKYKGKIYTLSTIAANRGTGKVKITEYVNPNGILNPGKVVGEFSGTLKTNDGSETLTITNGKFTSIKVL